MLLTTIWKLFPHYLAIFDQTGHYRTSLELLEQVHRYSDKIITKSGFMVGFGEGWGNILELLHDLASVNCERVTIGQYQQPTRGHWPVIKYYHPDEFELIKKTAYEMGLKHVEAGPLVRSSFHAADILSTPAFLKGD